MLNDNAACLGQVWDPALGARLIELNEQLIEMLRRDALAAPAYGAPPLIAALAQEWQALDAQAGRRLADCPYLLLEAGFAQPERWEHLSGLPVMDGAPGGYFRCAGGVPLLRRSLVFAWHLSSCNPPMARICLGACGETGERIAAASLEQLERLAERAPPWITPRWAQQPRIWRQLLRAARTGKASALREAQLRGLQLLATRAAPVAAAH